MDHLPYFMLDMQSGEKTDPTLELGEDPEEMIGNYCRATNFSTFIPDLYNETCMESAEKALWERLQVLKFWEELIFLTLYALIVLLGVIGNGLVIFVIINKAEMRTNRNVFITNLAICNFLLALATIPFLWIPAVHYTFPYGRFLCKMTTTLPASNIFCSTLTISVMAVDRFISINRTKSQINFKKAVIISMAIWLVSIALGLPFIIFYDINIFPKSFINIPLHPNGTRKTFAWPICQLAPEYSEKVQRTITIIMGVVQACFLYIIPLFVLFFFNYRLSAYLERQASEQLKWKQENAQEVDKIPLPMAQALGSAMESNMRRRSRTTKLLAAMAASYAILWLPFTLMSFLYDFKLIVGNNAVAARIDYVAKLVSLMSICVNPFLYGYMNTNYNREFKDILSKVPVVGGIVQAYAPYTDDSRSKSFLMSTYAQGHTRYTFTRGSTSSMVNMNNSVLEEKSMVPHGSSTKSDASAAGSSDHNVNSAQTQTKWKTPNCLTVPGKMWKEQNNNQAEAEMHAFSTQMTSSDTSDTLLVNAEAGLTSQGNSEFTSLVFVVPKKR